MALETGTYISDLVATNPSASDPKSQGDDHLKLIKFALKSSFPNVTGPVTATQAQLNLLIGKSDVATAADIAAASFSSALPGQTGNAGKFVTTNGTTPSWVAAAFQTAAASSDIKTGSDTTKAVTSAAVLGALGFSAYVQTADQTITAGGLLTIAHGLGRTPVLVFGFLKNTVAEYGYSIGDIIPASIGASSTSASTSCAVTMDATNIYITFNSLTYAFSAPIKSTGVSANLTNSNWKFILRALA